jgi:L-asparaginase II
MLTLARYLGVPTEGYLNPEHQVQRRILDTLVQMCGVGKEEVRAGVDGCSAPIYAVPLQAAATAYARLVHPSDLPAERAAACRRVARAMVKHPEMVAGQGRLDTRLMQVTGGRILSKGGAEGYQGIAVRREDPPGGIGIAIKVADEDATRRARGPISLAVLQMLGALSAKELAELEDFGPASITNHRGRVVGDTQIYLQLAVGHLTGE